MIDQDDATLAAAYVSYLHRNAYDETPLLHKVRELLREVPPPWLADCRRVLRTAGRRPGHNLALAREMDRQYHPAPRERTVAMMDNDRENRIQLIQQALKGGLIRPEDVAGMYPWSPVRISDLEMERRIREQAYVESRKAWDDIQEKLKSASVQAPPVLKEDPVAQTENVFDLAWRQREPKYKEIWDTIHEQVEKAEREAKETTNDIVIYLGKALFKAFGQDLKRVYGAQIKTTRPGNLCLAGARVDKDENIHEDGCLILGEGRLLWSSWVAKTEENDWVIYYSRHPLDGNDETE